MPSKIVFGHSKMQRMTPNTIFDGIDRSIELSVSLVVKMLAFSPLLLMFHALCFEVRLPVTCTLDLIIQSCLFLLQTIELVLKLIDSLLLTGNGIIQCALAGGAPVLELIVSHCFLLCFRFDLFLQLLQQVDHFFDGMLPGSMCGREDAKKDSHGCGFHYLGGLSFTKVVQNSSCFRS